MIDGDVKVRKGPIPRPIPERFWEKVDKNGKGGCWLWLGHLDPWGYGQFGIVGRSMKQGEPMKAIDEWIEQTTYREAVLREQRLRALIQPRPWWVPEWMWKKVLARVLVLEEHMSLDRKTEGQNTTGIGIDAPDEGCCGRPDEPHYHRETLDRIERVPVESSEDRIVVTEIHKVTARQLSGVHYRLTCPCGWRYYTDRRNNDARSIALRHEAG